MHLPDEHCTPRQTQSDPTAPTAQPGESPAPAGHPSAGQPHQQGPESPAPSFLDSAQETNRSPRTNPPNPEPARKTSQSPRSPNRWPAAPHTLRLRRNHPSGQKSSQPPVTGGKDATSSPAFTGVSALAMA